MWYVATLDAAIRAVVRTRLEERAPLAAVSLSRRFFT